ncbi:MAG: hypothetical protein RI952_792, partial [Bacteroidota bacterium]
MKKIILILFVFFSISIVAEKIYADGRANKNRNCLFGCINPRYKAISEIRRVNDNMEIEYQRDCKCSGQANAYTHHGIKPQGPYAMCYTHINSSKSWFEVEVIGNIYYPGFNPYKNFNRLILPTDSTDGETSMKIESYHRFADIENSNDIVIDSIVGYMRLKNRNGSTLYSRYEFAIWSLDNSEDTLRTEEKTLWKSTLTLTDGKVYGTGLFYNDNYYSIKETDSGTVLFINVNQEIGVDINEAEDISVEEWVDVQSDYSEESARFINPKEADEIYSNLLNEYSLNKFNIFPNPSNNNFRV